MEQVRAGATLVAANDRLARMLRQAYGERRRRAGETVWPSPRIHSWGVWIDRLWREQLYRPAEPLPTRLTADQERLVWEEVIRRREDEHRFLSVEATADAARRAWRLAVEWRVDRAALESGEAEDVRAFARWSEDFEAVCRREGWIDSARAVDALIASQALPGEGPILLIGFDVLTPQQKALLEALRRAGAVVREIGPEPARKREARRVECESRREEIRAAARWAQRIIERQPAARIGVVVPGLGARRQEVERIFCEAFDAPSLLLGPGNAEGKFVISAGLPLDRCPLIHSALTALEMQPDGMPFPAFAAWLRCRGVAGGDTERGARGALDRRLRDKGVATVTMRGLSGPLREIPALHEAMKRWARRYRRMPATQSPAGWTDTVSRLLTALGWPGREALSSEDLQVVEKWYEILAAFAGLGATAGEMDFERARRTLARMAAETSFQATAGQAPVEVMDLLESAGAELDYLWVAGLDDETWPSPPRPSPFLPIALQRELGLPHSSAATELRFARAETQRLLASAPHVVVSSATSVEDRKIGPSPLIAEIALAAVEDIAPSDGLSVIEAMHASARIEIVVDHLGPAIAPDEPALGGARIFEYQAHCPFRAFAQLRLGAQPLRTADPGLAAWERGLLVHDAMEFVWREIGDSDSLRRRSEGDLLDTVKNGVDHAMASLVEKRRERLPPRFEDVERRRLEELLIAWLAVERTARLQPFRAIAFEERRKVEIRGVTADVRIDRVDELADGRQIILDYKTGATKSKEWDHERPIEPQLPLYAVSHEEPLGGALFARLRAIGSGFQGAVGPGVSIQGVSDNRADDFEDRVAQWRRNLEALADEFLAGRAVVNPRDGKCRYCELPALCRKDERA